MEANFGVVGQNVTHTLFCYVSDVGASLLGQDDDVRCLAAYVRHLSQFAINVHSSVKWQIESEQSSASSAVVQVHGIIIDGDRIFIVLNSLGYQK